MNENNLQIIPRKSTERGHADHGWLKTFHTFSFASYYDPKHAQFGHLRVINEDRVDVGTGFGKHRHSEFEIFSYVVSGELKHEDSMGNIEILKRGDLQMTSAGSPGIAHSEYAHGTQPVHFLQIWALPWQSGLQSRYFTRTFTDDEKKDTWCKVVAPAPDSETSASEVKLERDAKGPAPVHSPLTLYATLLSPGAKLTSVFPVQLASPTVIPGTETRKKFVHVVQTSGYNTGPAQGASVKIGNGSTDSLELGEGDGAYIVGAKGSELLVENVGDRVAEVLLFDVE